ncbi:MAG: DUF401 family protein [Thermoprotei archaeon]
MSYLNTELAFFVSVILVLVLVFRKTNIAFSLGIGTIFYGVFTLSYDVLSATVRSFNLTMIEVIAALTLAMFLAGLFSSLDISSKMVEGLSVFGEKFAAVSTPAVVGLLPMPGGAYVSAVMTKSLYDEMRLAPHEETFINYWFRHVWIPSWPLFQGVILAAGVLGTTTQDIIKITWPVTIIAASVGLLLTIPRLKSQVSVRKNGSSLIHLWPFILIGLLTILIGIDVAISTAITVLIFILVYKPKKVHYIKALKHATNITILLVIIFSLIFSQYIKESGITSILAVILGPIGNFMAFLIPFSIGFATGIEFTYVALTFPPLIPLLSGYGLLFAFTGGYMGVMLSPAHSCLILSSQHYNAELPKVYKLIIPTVVITVTLVFLLFSVMNSFNIKI